MHRTRIASLAIATVVVLAACGNSGPTSAPASPAPASPGAGSPASSVSAVPAAQATPSPTSPDAATAFVATVRDPAFRARLSIDGQSTVGAVTTTTTGTLDLDAGASHLVTTSRTGTVSTTLETIVADGTRYLLTSGVWVSGGPAAGDDLVSVLGTITGATDLGVETLHGRTLHHLGLALPAVVPVEVDLAGTGIARAAATFEAWADPDGTPVILSVHATWEQAVGKTVVPGTRVLDLTVSDLGGSISVAVPADLWTFYVSSRFRYRMAYPVGWTLRKGTAKYADAYFDLDGPAVYASRAKRGGLTLTAISRSLARYLPKITGIASPRVDANRSARLGPLKARRIEFHYTLKGRRYWSVAYLAVKGGYYWWVAYETTTTTTDADREMIARFAATFDPR